MLIWNNAVRRNFALVGPDFDRIRIFCWARKLSRGKRVSADSLMIENDEQYIIHVKMKTFMKEWEEENAQEERKEAAVAGERQHL